MKENKDIKLKNSWDEITISEFLQLIQLQEVNDDFQLTREVEIMKILTGDPNIDDLSLPEFKQLMNKVTFMNQPIPETIYPSKSYNTPKFKYIIKPDLTKLTTAQYVDYTNYVKKSEGLEDLAKILSVFFIPKGFEYGEGYDMDEVIEDIENNVDIVTASSVANFFALQSQTCIKALKDYSIRMMKKAMKKQKDPIKKEELKKKISEVKML